MICFLDFEASSLHTDSYPIEVGWCFGTGDSGSFLIRPEPGWDDWSLTSQDLHGIPRHVLLADGLPAADVARRLVEVIGGCEAVYADSSLDGRWLGKLVAVAGIPAPPLRHVHDAYVDVLRPFLGHMQRDAANGIARMLLGQAREEADAAVRVRHRAADDARRMRETWRRLKEIMCAVDEEDG